MSVIYHTSHCVCHRIRSVASTILLVQPFLLSFVSMLLTVVPFLYYFLFRCAILSFALLLYCLFFHLILLYFLLSQCYIVCCPITLLSFALLIYCLFSMAILSVVPMVYCLLFHSYIVCYFIAKYMCLLWQQCCPNGILSAVPLLYFCCSIAILSVVPLLPELFQDFYPGMSSHNTWQCWRFLPGKKDVEMWFSRQKSHKCTQNYTYTDIHTHKQEHINTHTQNYTYTYRYTYK